jgi:hypothetical protein
VKCFKELDAVERWHHQIEKDDRILGCPRHLKRIGSMDRGMHIERLAAQGGYE